MRQSKQTSGERIVKDIKRKTRKQYSAESFSTLSPRTCLKPLPKPYALKPPLHYTSLQDLEIQKTKP